MFLYADERQEFVRKNLLKSRNKKEHASVEVVLCLSRIVTIPLLLLLPRKTKNKTHIRVRDIAWFMAQTAEVIHRAWVNSVIHWPVYQWLAKSLHIQDFHPECASVSALSLWKTPLIICFNCTPKSPKGKTNWIFNKSCREN